MTIKPKIKEVRIGMCTPQHKPLIGETVWFEFDLTESFEQVLQVLEEHFHNYESLGQITFSPLFDRKYDRSLS